MRLCYTPQLNYDYNDLVVCSYNMPRTPAVQQAYSMGGHSTDLIVVVHEYPHLDAAHKYPYLDAVN